MRAVRTGRRAAGFTIIEVLMVVVILGILVSMGLPSMRDLIASTKVKKIGRASCRERV